jgi:hypothetical protein
MSLKNLAWYRKTKNIFEFSVKNYVRNTKKFTCDKNCLPVQLALKVNAKWLANASVISLGSVTYWLSTLSWIKNLSFLLELETYFQKWWGLFLRLSSTNFNQCCLSDLIVTFTSLRENAKYECMTDLVFL